VQSPLVSVVVPVRGEPDSLAGAVESVSRQSHSPLEVVIVHAGDPVAFPASIRDQDVVRYRNEPPEGVAAARNAGIVAASGEVIGFCDADDRWHPAKLAEQLPAIEGGADVVYSDEFLVRDGAAYRLDALPVRNPRTHHVDFFRNADGVGSRTVIARAECFEAERFDTRFTMREDPHLWTRLFAAFHPAHVPNPLSYKRAREGSLSSDVDAAYRMERLEIEDLVGRFPELEPFREQRERALQYRYAKRLLSEDGRGAEAGRIVRAELRRNPLQPRLLALLALAAFPGDSRAATRRTQATLWRLRALRRRLANAIPAVGGTEPPRFGGGEVGD
jgi:glycosyltransferase involved in cell wall biosynthesis